MIQKKSRIQVTLNPNPYPIAYTHTIYHIIYPHYIPTLYTHPIYPLHMPTSYTHIIYTHYIHTPYTHIIYHVVHNNKLHHTYR